MFNALTEVLESHETGQGLRPWPVVVSVELPGIEPALTKTPGGNASVVDGVNTVNCSGRIQALAHPG